MERLRRTRKLSLKDLGGLINPGEVVWFGENPISMDHFCILVDVAPFIPVLLQVGHTDVSHSGRPRRGRRRVRVFNLDLSYKSRRFPTRAYEVTGVTKLVTQPGAEAGPWLVVTGRLLLTYIQRFRQSSCFRLRAAERANRCSPDRRCKCSRGRPTRHCSSGSPVGKRSGCPGMGRTENRCCQ